MTNHDEITFRGQSYPPKLTRPQSQRSLQKKVSRKRNGICPHPLTIGGNGWEVPKLSWSFKSYRD